MAESRSSLHIQVNTPHPSLFGKMKPSDSAEIFRANPDKKWLIRESEVDGMITIDFVNSFYDPEAKADPNDTYHKHVQYDSYRIGLLNNGPWIIANTSKQLTKIINHIKPITADNINKYERILHTFIKDKVLSHQGYDLFERALPNAISPAASKDRGCIVPQPHNPDEINEENIATQLLPSPIEKATLKKARTDAVITNSRAKTLLLRSNTHLTFFPSSLQISTLSPANSRSNTPRSMLSPATNSRSGTPQSSIASSTPPALDGTVLGKRKR